MNPSAELRRCMMDLDVAGAQRIWGEHCPHLPRPRNDAEALVTLHMARTAAASMPFKFRAYSHAWLTERGLPSSLPDNLKPKAERMYPRVVEAVGVAVKGNSHLAQTIAPLVERAMSDAVSEIYADIRNPQPAIVRLHMQEARERTLKKLLGSVKVIDG